MWERVDRWSPGVAWAAGAVGAGGVTLGLVEGIGDPGLVGAAAVVGGAAWVWRGGTAWAPAPEEVSPWWAARAVPGLPVDAAAVADALPHRGASELLATVLVPGVEAWLGSPESEEGRTIFEGPRRRVRLAPFLVGRTPVTKAEWRAVMGEERACPGGDAHPVTNVSWHDAVAFCNALSARERLPLAYDGERLVAGSDGWRLPTEAEWEAVCRAGTGTAYGWGDAFDAGRVWQDRQAHPVGSARTTNGWGVSDLVGHVFQWTTSCWTDRYPDVDSGVDMATDDVTLPGDAACSLRVSRGGSAWNVPRHLRSAHRRRHEPSYALEVLGFRCVRGARRPS